MSGLPLKKIRNIVLPLVFLSACTAQVEDEGSSFHCSGPDNSGRRAAVFEHTGYKGQEPYHTFSIWADDGGTGQQWTDHVDFTLKGDAVGHSNFGALAAKDVAQFFCDSGDPSVLDGRVIVQMVNEKILEFNSSILRNNRPAGPGLIQT